MSHSLLFFNLIMVVLVSGRQLRNASDGKTCAASYYRRTPCGYKYISEIECQRRGCCYAESVQRIPNCYNKVEANTVEKCMTTEYGRKPCGYRFISMYECQRRGCCYKSARSSAVPSCFKPIILRYKPTAAPTTTAPKTVPSTKKPSGSVSSLFKLLRTNGWRNVTRSCEVSATSRNDCGHPGITRETCVNKDCCWDNSILKAHWCFYPVWRSTGSIYSPTQRQSAGIREEDEKAISQTESTELLEPPIPTTMYVELETTDSSEIDISTRVEVTQYTAASSSPNTIAYVSAHDTATNAHATPTPEILPPYEDSDNPPINDEEFEHLAQKKDVEIKPIPAVTLTPRKEMPHNNNNWKSTQYMMGLKLLKYYSARQKKGGLTQMCSTATSNCCLQNPNSTCCETTSDSMGYTRASNPKMRIVGGGVAGHLRSSVAYLTTEYYRSQFCGGTLIRTNWVVTAAHCLLDYCRPIQKKPASEILVKLGKIDKSNYIRNKNEQVIRAAQVICHSHNCISSDQPRINDIALVRLSRHITRNKYVSPAALPYHGETPVMEKNCIVLGWGKTRGIGSHDVLKEVAVPPYTNEQCNRPDWRGCKIRRCMLCAGALNADACEGDSGGPLFCQRPRGLYVLQGVYSWGRCGSETKKPAVYTRFSYYVNWIKEQIYSEPST